MKHWVGHIWGTEYTTYEALDRSHMEHWVGHIWSIEYTGKFKKKRYRFRNQRYNDTTIASKMKLGDVLRMWGWYLGICSICTKFGADLCVFPAKFAKTRKLNQTFGYNDSNVTSSALINPISVQLLHRSSMLNGDCASDISRVIQWRATSNMRPKPDSWEEPLFVWATTRFSSWGEVKVLDIIPVRPCLLNLLFL